MLNVRLIHWKQEEGEQRAKLLRAAGYGVIFDAAGGPELLRDLRAHPPQAVVIDLTRTPSHGREVGVALRHSKTTRSVPLVFAGGEPEKVARVQGLLPDAVYTDWNEIEIALQRAIAQRPETPRAMVSVFEAYKNTPLVKKLGIKTDFVVRLLNAPGAFRKTLGELPKGVRISRGAGAPCDLLLWFVRTQDELRRDLVSVAGEHPIWIVWPKKSAGVATDLNQLFVRETGLAAGLVDYKICRIDETWAGLLFRWRKQQGNSVT